MTFFTTSTDISSEFIELQTRFSPENLNVSPHLIDKINDSSTKPNVFPFFVLPLNLNYLLWFPYSLKVFILFFILLIFKTSIFINF